MHVSELAAQLALIKVHALTHDPPHKSFLIKKLGKAFREQHRLIASAFRLKVFEGTCLSYGLGTELEGVVNEADRLASSFDRWILRVSRWPESTYVYYDHLHNIFDPAISEKLQEPREDVIEALTNDLKEAVKEAYIALGSEMLVYNTFFAVFEAYWYHHGLPPMLADTRVPTHTVFDHLYATATVSNLFVRKGGNVLKKSDKPVGYFVVVDIPGVQSFLNASRKAGDFWASSWILSNIVWSVVEHFALKYGFDVLVSPSPRLNPYTLRSVASVLKYGLGEPSFKLVFEHEPAREASEQDMRLRERINKVFKDIFGVDLEEALLQPIVPATALLIIPQAGYDSPGALLDEVIRAYRDSWVKLVGYVEEGLGGTEAARFLKKVLFEEKGVKSVLESPSRTPFVAVIDVGKAYERLVECVQKPNVELYSKIGLNAESKISEILRKRRIDAEELAKSLLWHILVNSWRGLLQLGAGESLISMPRPFWEYDVSTGALKSLGGYCDYVNCTLCGDEPAVIKATKEIRNGEVVFSEEFKAEVREAIETEARVSSMQIGKTTDLKLEEELSKIIKPGEALGPYCAFKRALYLVLSRNRGLRITSTDDVALSFLTKSLNELSKETRKTFYEKVVDRALELKVKLDETYLEYLLSKETQYRDLYFMAYAYQVPAEKFTSAISEAMRCACQRVLKRDVFEKFVKPGLPPELRDFLVEAPDRVCDLIALKTKIAIIRGDADDVGKILRGEKGKSPDEVAKTLIEYLNREGKFYGSKEEAVEALKEGYSTASELAKVLGLKSLPVSPAVTSSISLSLMLASLRDWQIVREQGGLLVYSGGDDVMALTPAENAIDTALKLREAFYEKGFKKIMGNPVLSEIPTGRSFSLRYVSLLDVPSEESKETYELLEEKAKKAKWVRDDYVFSEKDSLVVSSSRSGSVSIISLRPISDQQSALKGLLNALKSAQPLLLTCLSTNLPEDFEGFRDKALMERSDALRRVLEYVISRNIQLGKQDSKIKSDLAKRLADALAVDAWLQANGEERRRPALEFLSLLRILRWVF